MTREDAEIYAKTMTYEDALYNLSQARAIPYRKATFIKVNELIKALSQEPTVTSTDEPMTMVYPTIECDDAVSREAVVDDFIEWREKLEYTVGEDYSGVHLLNVAIQKIWDMPPVTPRRKGHWIFQKIRQGKRMWCSNCDSAFDLCCNQIKRYNEATMSEDMWTYCPWCGAKMVEPQESED